MTTQPFRDIDDSSIFHPLLKELCKPTTSNFLVSFDVDTAEAGINLKTVELTSSDRIYGNGEKRKCRWLNLWGWRSDHSNAIKEIAKRYDISPRLTEVLCPTQRTSKVLSGNIDNGSNSSSSQSNGSSNPESIVLTAQTSSHNTAATSKPERHPHSLGDLVDNLWHFCTVDSGDRYLCVGYNALFGDPEKIVSTTSSKPNVIRIWSTTLICDDGLVVSVFEDPPGMTPEEVKLVRTCQLNIFQNLSKLGPAASDVANIPLMQVAVRPFNVSPDTAKAFDSSSAASLIFYYLMDDWTTTYKLLMQRGHPYRQRIEYLRQNMEIEAHVQLMKELHLLGKQLSVLRLVYSSYELIINRILVQQRYLTMPTTITKPSSNRSPLASSTSHFTSLNANSTGDLPPIAELRGDRSIQLSTPSLVRFERLLDRVRLYALNEIEECLSEKESLVFLNFNFISLKETQAVERLSRVTVFLAKATILFLPISILTGYFSLQVPEIATFTLRQYWVAFAVLVILTLFVLYLFGLASDTVESKVVYRSFTKNLYYFVKGRKEKHR